jgi:hypothetical protein
MLCKEFAVLKRVIEKPMPQCKAVVYSSPKTDETAEEWGNSRMWFVNRMDKATGGILKHDKYEL